MPKSILPAGATPQTRLRELTVCQLQRSSYPLAGINGDLLLREGDGCRTAERSLSVLKRLQTYLRNSLSQRKMNSLDAWLLRES